MLPVHAAQRTHTCVDYSADVLEKKASKYNDEITAAAERFSLDRHLIISVITVESCFKVKAKSHKNAQGLMQLIPATAERFGVTDITNPAQNVRAGSQYLRWLLNRYDGKLDLALAGYNAGEGRVDKHMRIPRIKETIKYVKLVKIAYQKLSPTVHFGDIEFDVVNITPSKKVKKKKKLAPQEPIPQVCKTEAWYGKNKKYKTNYDGYMPGRIVGDFYIIDNDDNLEKIAAKADIDVKTLAKINSLSLSRKHKLTFGHKLRIQPCRT